MYSLRPHQVPHFQQLWAAIQHHGFCHDGSDTGCHAPGTKLLRYDGRVVAVEDVQVGDQLMGPDSTPRTVLRLIRGEGEMVRVIPVKGDPFVVNKDHILTLVQTNTGPSRPTTHARDGMSLDVPVREWMGWSKPAKHIHKLFRVGVVFPEDQSPLEIDPYMLGVFLGDGCLLPNHLSVTTAEPEVERDLRTLAEKFSCRVARREGRGCADLIFRESSALKAVFTKLGLLGKIGKDKFIPAHYLTRSVDERMQLLAGLLDTDGCIAQNGYDFINVSPDIANGTAFLARSLGLAAYVKPCRKGCQTGAVGDYFRVSISGTTSRIPCRVPRRIAAERTQKKSVLRTGFSVEEIGHGSYFGFELDGDRRYLMADFTVTHNTGKTFCGAALAAALGVEVLVVCPLSVVPSWQDVLAGFGVKNATVINYQKAWRRLGKLQPWGKGSFFIWNKTWPLVIFDEVHRACGESTINAKMVIAAKRAGSRILSVSATVADTPLRMKAWGYTMGLHNLTDWQSFLLKCNCRPGPFGGWVFNRKTNQMIIQGLHEQIYLSQDGVPAKGARLRKQDIPGFPKTQVSVRTLPCADRSVLRLSAELQELYRDRSVQAAEAKQEARRRVEQAEDAVLRGDLPETYDVEQAGRGYRMTEILRLRQALEVAKLPDIEDMIEDKVEDSKVVVFCNFNATIDELLKVAAKHKWTVGVIRGEQSESERGKRERRETELAFQRNELDLILVNVQAGGVGLSLHDPFTQYNRTALLCPTYSPVDLKQSLGRVQRDGGGFSEQYLLYFSEGIESRIASVVGPKIQSLDLLNDGELSGEMFQ